MDQENLNELMQVRRRKMDQLRERGVEPHGKNKSEPLFHRDYRTVCGIENSVVTVTGRIVSIRAHGKASFAHLQDYKAGSRFISA